MLRSRIIYKTRGRKRKLYTNLCKDESACTFSEIFFCLERWRGICYFYFTGVEPWSFYFLNGFLNFNIVFPMALLALPACVSTWTVKKTLLIILIAACVKAWNKFYLTFNHFESSCTLCSAEKVRTSNNNAAVIAAKLFHSCMMHMQCESQFWCLLAAKFPANGKGFHQRMVQWFIYLEWNI